MGSRFLLVGTPSGITLAGEGGAHQSINTPLIGMGQPNLDSFEPAFADELALIMRWSFEHLQAPDGASVYLRLTTRAISQPVRPGADWEAGAIDGAYWLRHPGPNAEAAIAYCGAVAPEAIAAWEGLQDDLHGLGLLAVTSPDRLHRDWSASQAARWTGQPARESHIEMLLGSLRPGDSIHRCRSGCLPK